MDSLQIFTEQWNFLHQCCNVNPFCFGHWLLHQWVQALRDCRGLWRQVLCCQPQVIFLPDMLPGHIPNCNRTSFDVQSNVIKCHREMVVWFLSAFVCIASCQHVWVIACQQHQALCWWCRFERHWLFLELQQHCFCVFNESHPLSCLLLLLLGGGRVGVFFFSPMTNFGFCFSFVATLAFFSFEGIALVCWSCWNERNNKQHLEWNAHAMSFTNERLIDCWKMCFIDMIVRNNFRVLIENGPSWLARKKHIISCVVGMVPLYAWAIVCIVMHLWLSWFLLCFSKCDLQLVRPSLLILMLCRRSYEVTSICHWATA